MQRQATPAAAFALEKPPSANSDCIVPWYPLFQSSSSGSDTAMRICRVPCAVVLVLVNGLPVLS